MILSTHFKSSITIIKTHTIVLLITAVVSGIIIANYLLSYYNHSNILSIPVLAITFSTSLVMYGLYYEIIEDKYTSMREIFSKYLFGYFLVSLISALPIILISLPVMLTSSGNTYQVIQNFFALLVSIVFMYVVPYYFLTNQVIESFRCGIGFLIKNFSTSLPIITAIFILYISEYFFSSTLNSLVNINAYLFSFLQYTYVFLNFIVDYALFIVLLLTIKHKQNQV